MKSSFEGLSDLLKKSKIRPSHQRLKILEYLINNQCHPTVDQIFNDLNKDIPTLSKSTVYNTLNSLLEVHLVRVINIEDNETRYDINTKDHGHFKCESCGNIYDFNIDMNGFSTDELNGFEINDKSVYFKGTCTGCLFNKNIN